MNLYEFMPKEGKYLEIGPLDSPFLKRPEYDVYYMDVRTTEEIKRIYKGSYADLERIVEIDYPTGVRSYQETVGKTKFSGVYSSHCMEHTYDMIGHLREVAGILEEGGRYVFVVPDMSNFFDCYRHPISFREVYGVFIGGAKNGFVADSVMNTSRHYEGDDIKKFWHKQISFIPELLCEGPRIKMAKEIYESEDPMSYAPSCHVWAFTYDSLLEILRDCLRFNLLPFTVEVHEAILDEKSCNIYMVLKKNSDILIQDDMRLCEILKIQMFLEKRRGIINPLVKVMKSGGRLFLYGAGLVGKRLYKLLKDDLGLKCEIEFLVSDDRKLEKGDLPGTVNKLSDIRQEEDFAIIIAVANRKYADEMELNLKNRGLRADYHYFRL